MLIVNWEVVNCDFVLIARCSSARCCRRRVEIRQSLEICGDDEASYNRHTF